MQNSAGFVDFFPSTRARAPGKFFTPARAYSTVHYCAHHACQACQSEPVKAPDMGSQGPTNPSCCVVVNIQLLPPAMQPRHARARCQPASRAACAWSTHSGRSVSELTFTVSQATHGWVHARRPVSGVARCRPSARRPTGRRRRPEASAPSSARPRRVLSEMTPRNRALGDGGADQVHGPASVRLGAVGERARCGSATRRSR